MPETDALIAGLRGQCGGPRDGALLRFSLGRALLAASRFSEAVAELELALSFDAKYSAAWKALGQAHVAGGDESAAIAAFERGIEVATARGDTQVAREMAVYLRRLKR